MTQVGQTIVVGIDYSDSCIPALDQALELAQGPRRTELVVVLALSGGPPTRPSEAEEFARELVERSKQNLLGLVQSRCDALGLAASPATPVVRFGTPVHCLLEEAKLRAARLIVVGTHGRKELEHLFLGSVAREVAERASCSVLVARGPARAAEVARAPEEPAFEAAEARGPSAAHGAQVLSEPHIDAGRLVLNVLDEGTGQVFRCSFDDIATVRVEPLEGDWVPQPPSDSRARAARAAIDFAQREPALFLPLFTELRRRTAEPKR